MAHDERESRDAAGIGPYARERENLVTLSSLGSWNVSEGEPDIRGWEVRTVSGRQLGQVSELLVDPQAREVVMLDIDLPGTDRHSFVPIRVVEIDRTRRIILMDSADLPMDDAGRAAPLIAEQPVVTRPVAAQPIAGRPVVAEAVAVDPRDHVRRTVSYPRGDREVVVERVGGADDVVAADAAESEAIVDRRRAERRRIERLSTDL